MGSARFGRCNFEISNNDKLLFPDSGISKGTLIAYFRDIAEVMLPHHPPPTGSSSISIHRIMVFRRYAALQIDAEPQCLRQSFSPGTRSRRHAA
jgi:hypothetical protein